MKKIIVLVFTIFMFSQFAYSVTTEKEVITVTYAVDTPSVIGFSVNAVNYATPVSNLKEILFKADSSGKFITDEFYIYWQLYSQDNVKISLTMEPLVYEGNELHYQVETIYILNNLITNDIKTKTGIVLDESEETINSFRMSSIPLALRLISTDTANVKKGDYLGSLTLTLEVI